MDIGEIFPTVNFMKKFIFPFLHYVFGSLFFLWTASAEELPFPSRRLEQLSTEQKVGQIFMIMDDQLTGDEAKKLSIGAILIGPRNQHRQHIKEIPDWAAHYRQYGSPWVTEGSEELPMIFAIDAVHGNALVPGMTVFPHNIGLGAMAPGESRQDLIKLMGQTVAREVAAIGANLALGPAVSVTRDGRWGRTYEGWGQHPGFQDGGSNTYIEAVQSTNPHTAPVLTCAKHYLADGQPIYGTGRSGGIDQGDVQLREEILRKYHLPPYQRAIEADVASIMVSFGKWKGTEMHHHDYLLKEVLKDELGFQGIVLSDMGGFFETGEDPGERAISSFNSGVDMLMMRKDWRKTHAAVLAAVRRGEITQERLDEAVGRILHIKDRLVVRQVEKTPANLLGIGGNWRKSHFSHAARIAATTLVELKNEKNALPFDPAAKTMVVGRKAVHAGFMCGGWTINWGGLQEDDDPGQLNAIHVVDALKTATSDAGGTVVHSAEFLPDSGASQYVVVVGERPTAEWRGDSECPALSQEDIDLIESVAGQDKPTVVVILGGRPLVIPPNTYAKADAWIMAWLPGSGGGVAIAEAVMGNIEMTGRLPMTWPAVCEAYSAPGWPMPEDQRLILFPAAEPK